MIIPRKQRINAFVHLGKFLNEFLSSKNLFEPEEKTFAQLSLACVKSNQKNGWFTEVEIRRALTGITYLLEEEKLNNWINDYDSDPAQPNQIGVITAGNIPAVGFHDFLSVLISGNVFYGKLSEQDKFLLPAFTNILIDHSTEFKSFIQFEDGQLKGADAYIATGSNNTARYFEYYFGKYPNIIRKNRTSIAILENGVTNKEIEALGKDIFWYYGLGCRNVTKLYLEKGFELSRIFEAILPFAYIMENKKYANNYIYHQSIYLMSQEKLLDNGFLNLRPHTDLTSQVGVLHYEFFEDKAQLNEELSQKANQIQAIVSRNNVPFGKAQQPELTDYADGVNTLDFLANLALR